MPLYNLTHWETNGAASVRGVPLCVGTLLWLVGAFHFVGAADVPRKRILARADEDAPRKHPAGYERLICCTR